MACLHEGPAIGGAVKSHARCRLEAISAFKHAAAVGSRTSLGLDWSRASALIQESTTPVGVCIKPCRCQALLGSKTCPNSVENKHRERGRRAAGASTPDRDCTAAGRFDAPGVAEGHTAWETPALRLKSARRRYLWTPRARSAPDRKKFHIMCPQLAAQ